jgi:hypothetical protein
MRRPAAFPSAPLLLAVLTAVLAGALGGPAPAAETRVTFTAGGRDASAALAGLSELAGQPFELGVDQLLAGQTSRRVTLALVDAPPAAARQACAHALRCWWAERPGGDGRGTLLTALPHLPQGVLQVRSRASGLRGDAAIEEVVRRLLEPWLDGGAGLGLEPSDGTWAATLDGSGHARLAEILAALEQPAPRIAPWLPDSDGPDPEQALTGVRGNGWADYAPALAVALGCSVSCDPALAARPLPEGLSPLPDTSAGALPARFAAAGVAARYVHGVLCLGGDAADEVLAEREHPAQRRRLALIPIEQLAATRLDGEFIISGLRAHVVPAWWTQPGAGLLYLERARTLLIAGDALVQERVLAALARLDRLGTAAGLRSLAEP